ncbi:hypothetical protein Ancab_010914 [Ancistrocladus abbreviatus]
MTVNTVLSLLAVDYPADKLACYVSDDGCSPLTFFSLVEASKFAKLWVPFCKKYGIPIRAPFRFFSTHELSSGTAQFRQDWQRMKEEYEELSRKILDVATPIHGTTSTRLDLTGEFEAFANVERNHHPTIIKVISDNKDGEINGEVPHLVYISREKRPKHHHHYKAGAMNVLARVSGMMTNAPFMLNVDCDMFPNDPQVMLHAMCLFLGSKSERDSGFIQAPQKFYDAPKDDPYGNQFVVLQHYLHRGMGGIQGPMYCGTGCMHRRKVIYGLSPDHSEVNRRLMLKGGELGKLFGNSTKFCESAAHALSGLEQKIDCCDNISSSMEAAYQVAGCNYEYGSSWGNQVGWVYGSTTEDIVTGLRIHRKGWRSMFLNPDPPAFLGCAPTGGPGSLTQQKRWATGFTEVLFSKNSPILATLNGKLEFKACFFYLWMLTCGLRSVPELCYTVLPAYCIITNTAFLPKVQEKAICVFASLFVSYNLYTLWEFNKLGQSIKVWWNNQKMARIYSTCSWFFGFLAIILKLLSISPTVFEITQKDQSSTEDDDHNKVDVARFTFDESPKFVAGTAILFLHLISLAIVLSRLSQQPSLEVDGSGLGEVLCSVLVVLYFSPFLKGLFGRGKYGIPTSIMYKSIAFALLFVHLCTWRQM